MKKLIMIPLAGLLFLAGCGDDDGGSGGEKVSMVIGEAVSVYPGDTIEPGGDDARIAIRHEVGEEVKSVTLLEGAASLLRGDYQVQ